MQLRVRHAKWYAMQVGETYTNQTERCCEIVLSQKK